MLLAVAGFTASAGTITLKTGKAVNSELTFTAYCGTVDEAITIDWGDGQPVSYNKNPNGWGSDKITKGTVKGETITITGNLIYFDAQDDSINSIQVTGMDKIETFNVSKNQITAITLANMPALTRLDLSKNKITSPNLNISGLAETLKYLEISENELVTLNLNTFKALEYFYAKKNASLTTVVFYDGSTSLGAIDMSECDIVHFYAISLPNLTSLNLGHNSLLDLEVGSYPKLSSLNVSFNEIMALDVTTFTTLTSLNCASNNLKELNISQCRDLTSLNCSDNQISHLTLSNNKRLNSILCANNLLTELDLSVVDNIANLDISGNKIDFVDLTKAYNLTTFRAANTLCSFFYFNYVNPWGRFSEVDVRNNPNMTSASLNCMFHTMPARSSNSYNTTLFIEGSNGEHSDTSYPNSDDMKWKTDVTGDGTATNSDVAVKLLDAVDTGLKNTVTGAYGGITSDQTFVLTKYSTAHGTFSLAQWSGSYYQQLADVTTTAKAGVPLVVMPVPEEGYRFKSVTVNGKEYKHTWFIVNEAADIKVNFAPTERYVKFSTGTGQALSFAVQAQEENTTIAVDWGNGARNESVIGTTVKRLDGEAAGDTITVYGDITMIDLSSYGEYGELTGLWNNKVTGIDFTHNTILKKVDVYMNQIPAIDVTMLPDLTELDCSYNEQINTLDVSKNLKLEKLSCYGNSLDTLDVAANVNLQSLIAKVNKIKGIDLSNNTKLMMLDLAQNQMSNIDLSKLSSLQVLRLSNNLFENVNVTANPELTELTVSGNKLQTLDLSKNTMLQNLSFNDNMIHALDLSKLTDLRKIDCGGNGMDACQMDDFYFTLPQYPDIPKEERPTGATLVVLTGVEPTPNAAKTADSNIAVAKGWIPSIEGDASGCSMAHVVYDPASNGTFKLTDADGIEIQSGDKVAKNSPITVTATPDAGYILNEVTVNGIAITGTTFTVTRYAKVVVTFATTTGIDDAQAQGINIATRQGAILFTATAHSVAEVYNLQGQVMGRIALDNGQGEWEVPAGTYAVKLTTADGKVARQLVVVK